MRLILKSFALEIHMHLIRRKLGARGKISWYNSGSGTFTFKTGIIALFIKHHLTLLSSTQNVYFFMFSAHGKFNFGGKLHNFLGSLLQNSKCWTLSSFERVETNGFFSAIFRKRRIHWMKFVDVFDGQSLSITMKSWYHRNPTFLPQDFSWIKKTGKKSHRIILSY